MKRLLLLLTITICISSCSQQGCTDPSADNYDSSAEEDDGSCIYTQFQKYCNYTIDGNSVNSLNYFQSTNFGTHMFQAYQGNLGSFPDMVFNVAEDIGTGTYVNEGMFGMDHQFHYLTGANTPTEAYYGNGNSGSFIITNYDETNNIIEGTFSGTLSNSIGDEVIVSHGFFGFNY